MPQIRITVDNKPALTVDQAAAEHDMQPRAMRAALDRANVEPVARLWRQPLYLTTDVNAMLKRRPGRGRPGVPRPHRPPVEG